MASDIINNIEKKIFAQIFQRIPHERKANRDLYVSAEVIWKSFEGNNLQHVNFSIT